MNTMKLTSFFHSPSLAPQQGEDQLVRGVVSIVARDDYNLVCGRYVTRTDKEKMRLDMAKYVIQMPS